MNINNSHNVIFMSMQVRMHIVRLMLDTCCASLLITSHLSFRLNLFDEFGSIFAMHCIGWEVYFAVLFKFPLHLFGMIVKAHSCATSRARIRYIFKRCVCVYTFLNHICAPNKMNAMSSLALSTGCVHCALYEIRAHP